MRTAGISSLLLLALVVTGCGRGEGEPYAAQPPDLSAEEVPGVTYASHLEPAGLQNYIRWSSKVGQSAQPEGEVAFRNLKALGYKTILSVDGSVPDVETAEKYGLRYVHVPIGYDGITHEQALKIVKAVRSLEGPVLVHCHHGVHRGPAAAQICRISEDGVSNAKGIAGLETSGTSPNYKGLWRDVLAFEKPTKAELAKVSDEFPSAVRPQGLRAGMVETSQRWSMLKACSKARWRVSVEHPDVDPAHEARMFWEMMREMARNDPEASAQGEIFLKYLKATEDEAIALEKAIRASDVGEADARFDALKQLCKDCHRDYRN